MKTPDSFTPLQTSVLNALSFRFGSFKPTPRITSPFIPDKRALISSPRLLSSIASHWAETVPDCSLVGGAALFGIPLAAALAISLEKHLVMIRRERKAYHYESAIDGLYEAGQTVILVDDTIASGDMARAMIRHCRNAALRPVALFIVLAIDPIARLSGVDSTVDGVPVVPIVTLTQLFAHHRHALAEQAAVVEHFLLHPEAYLQSSHDKP